MAINLKSTKDAHEDGVKILVYGQAGAGKTRLIRTLPSPVIFSAEAGLLSLKDENIPYETINSMDDLRSAYQWCVESEEAKQFKSIALDSISEVAETVLAKELKNSKDGRAAYGEMNNVMMSLIRSFRDIAGKHVYMSAKLDKIQDENGRILYGPMMPGKLLSNQLPYLFSEVFALRAERTPDGEIQRALQCQSDGLWQAKDRSGVLEPWEEPDLGKIIGKIGE